MPTIRIGYGSDFSINSNGVGIGTTFAAANTKLDVVGALKGDFNVTGVATLTAYGGFVAQQQHVNKSTTIGFATVGLGTALQYYETEIGFTDLGGVHHGDDQYFNTLSQDLVIDDGQILNITDTDMVGFTTIGEYDPHSHSSYVCAGSLEQVSVTGHFSVPNGGTNERPDQPTEGMVRFNDDLNTLEFFNGNEWRQFTYNQGQSGRGVFAGGLGGPAAAYSSIEYVKISSLGNSQDFGVLTTARYNTTSCSSSIRGITAGGSYNNTIDYYTLASEGNAVSFGNLSTTNRAYLSALSSSTRGVFGGGYTTSPANSNVDVIDYIEIDTLGTAVDFGNLSTAKNSVASVASPTRGIYGGGGISPSPGSQSAIEFITISSKGDSVFFGDLSKTRGNTVSSASNNVRGLYVDEDGIEYITIASNGNGIDFGNSSSTRGRGNACTSQTRFIYAGGLYPTYVNIIDYVEIATQGNAQDFGDLSKVNGALGACSDSHGGLGGF
jgi:hypothetical protein